MTFDANQAASGNYLNQVVMKAISPFLLLLIFFAFSNCDPGFDLMLENQAGNSVEVIFHPSLDNFQHVNMDTTPIEIQGLIMNKLTLPHKESIPIGTVIAQYVPEYQDLDIEYLEIRSTEDTIRLTGKKAILSMIQKVEKLDWRIIVR